MMDDHEPRSNFGWIFMVLVVVLSGALFLVMGKGCAPDEPPAAGEPKEETRPVDTPEEVKPPGEKEDFTPSDGTGTPATDETAEEILATLGVGVTGADPGQLVHQIGRQLESGKVREAAQIIGRDALKPEQIERLRKLATGARLKLNTRQPVTEIGELEINRLGRWALNLAGEEKNRIYFDLERRENGKWAVKRMALPREALPGEPVPRATLVDALGITDAFLQAALEQKFDDAKSFVDSEAVSDAKLAGLCIIFEEGKYHLRDRRPLRAMFNRETTAGFLANVQAADGSNAAQFGVTVQREDAAKPWRVTEINLDTLLADYAERVAGGDVYFTPLVRNPEGGDTLILYFDFDEAGITPRTARQLEIVTLLLQTDPNKQLRLSGHTDAIGSEDYNRGLSAERAAAVKQFLVDSGVDPQQIKTIALGKSKPRRPNVTETGEDDPSGRRANRRTEIYLDF
ncbi:MAG: OmpA family protein [Akkermansiaceae bacterium]|nr:OmpA family protein [Akkermansiaceae bacterium]NNM30765.1 OmpA family protein [Akkermansiaceae bacterium]